MNHYQTSTPRAAFGIAAAVLTAMTIGLAVVLPAKMDAGRASTGTLATVKAVTPTVTGGSIIPARIDLQHTRKPELASRRADGNGAGGSAQGSPTACPAAIAGLYLTSGNVTAMS